MNGLFLIDKPSGLSSHDVVRRVRRACGTRKVGHAGTLDPMATGVLLVAVNDATKLLQFLLVQNKSYRATLKLGQTTDTLDAEGQLLQQRPLRADIPERIETVLERYRGEIEQLPPMYSAIKQGGVPLYKLARQGQEVARKPRRIWIEQLVLLEQELPRLSLEVHCSKGTYIRSLVADIGEDLGCGAHLIQLCRLRTGRFLLQDCLQLEQLEDLDRACCSRGFIPFDRILLDYPHRVLQPAEIERLSHGVPPQAESVPAVEQLKPGAPFCFSDGESLLAVASYCPERQQQGRRPFNLIRVFHRE